MKRIVTVALMIALMTGVVFAQGSSEKTTAAASTSKKTLRVAMECGYAPYNWTQTDASNGAVPIADSNDYAYGYDVMMAKLIAEKLGYQLQIVKLDWDSLVPAVQSGSVDCVIAGQSITSDRMQMVDFTTPYYYASIVCLTNSDSKYASAKGITDLSGGTCTSQLGTVWYDTCLPQIPKANVLPAQESAPAMLVALNSKRVDFICTDMPTAQAAIVAYPNMKILDFTGGSDDFKVSQEDINIGVSVSKKNPELTKAINGVLATLTVVDFNTMMDKAISVQPLSTN
ncbi:transporter substrate-binding domain-containing protein [uncultured Sphaerochaeta sp.]|uniref:transporter substrate-binding domain-containing protein n=1 Tax=uncultured Sphaerochaeta sp. TaxID=886478 RepID=UPI002A0A8E1E|nr:transporter substrate-binding domain-containing protein [uncultured Sphaerochaeta sp.]